MKAANRHGPSNVRLSIICLRVLYCGWLISPISVMNQEHRTNLVIRDEECEDTWESILSFNIEVDNLDQQQKVLHLGQVCLDKSLCTSTVPLRKKQSCCDTAIACPPLLNSENLPGAMTPLLLNHQMSAHLNTCYKSDFAPSGQALMLPNKSSGNQNIPQPKTSSDQIVP
jgi:hypothetical protein